MSDPVADRRRELIAALLGPGEPEITCEECFEELDRYVDLELAGADAGLAVPGMRAHLTGCPACREDHESLRALAGTRMA
jgi:anti-sigma factor RsiW